MLLETLWASKHRTFSMICRERVRSLENRYRETYRGFESLALRVRAENPLIP
jgi:hypothetical protein